MNCARSNSRYGDHRIVLLIDHMHGAGPGGDVPTGLRVVLSDWDLAAQPPRAEYLRLQRDAGGHWRWQRTPMV